MELTKQDIKDLDRISRLKIINSVTGIKPANLIGTINSEGNTNLAIFSSVVHLGSSPALLGFISRPQTPEVGHTLRNIEENGFYTINHIHPKFIKNAHFTSAKFDASTSEFDRCNLSEHFIDGFKAPFVEESYFRIGMKYKMSIPIALNNTVLVIGEIEHLLIPDNALINEGIDLEASDSVGISGLNTYYSLKKLNSFPYAKVNMVPKF